MRALHPRVREHVGDPDAPPAAPSLLRPAAQSRCPPGLLAQSGPLAVLQCPAAHVGLNQGSHGRVQHVGVGPVSRDAGVDLHRRVS